MSARKGGAGTERFKRLFVGRETVAERFMQKQTQPKDRRFLKIVVGALIALLILIVIVALATDPR